MELNDIGRTTKPSVASEHDNIYTLIAAVNDRLSTHIMAIENLAMDLYGVSTGDVTDIAETPERPGVMGSIQDACDTLHARMERAESAFSQMQR